MSPTNVSGHGAPGTMSFSAEVATGSGMETAARVCSVALNKGVLPPSISR